MNKPRQAQGQWIFLIHKIYPLHSLSAKDRHNKKWAEKTSYNSVESEKQIVKFTIKIKSIFRKKNT